MSTPTLSIQNFKKNVFSLCVSVYLCECMPCVCRYQQGLENGIKYPGSELQVIVSYPVWVLGNELKSSGRATSALDCLVTHFSPSKLFQFYRLS